MASAGYIGTLPGDLAVDSDGDAAYSIPIEVPPGTAGMMPNLSIAYNSGGGNDVMGMGWTLRGLSSITRSPRTMAQDGVRGTVNYGPDDRYSLDGARLVPVSGNYGDPDAIYHTEIESWTRVVPVYYGQNGNTTPPVPGRSGPDAFIVHTKDGKVHEYGTSADSQIVASASNPSVRVWALTKITDLFGNALAISYQDDADANSFYPVEMDYTSNEAAGLVAQRSVLFQYEDRPLGPDGFPRYQGGYGVTTRLRLRSIETKLAGETVLTYAFQYQQGDATGRSQLISITKADAEGVALRPTSLAWQDGDPALLASDRPVSAPGAPAVAWQGTLLPMDVNGDGRIDLVNVSEVDGFVQLTLFLSQGSGFGVPIPLSTTGIPMGGATQVLPIDFNGDGCIDLVVGNQLDDYMGLTVLKSEPGGPGGWTFTRGPLNGAGPTELRWGGHLIPMDVDGDGLVDLVYVHADDEAQLAVTALFSDGEEFAPSPTDKTTTSLSFEPGARYIPLDFNGDGMTDLLYAAQDRDNTDFTLFTSVGREGFEPGLSLEDLGSIPWGGALIAIDVNGDGLVDLVHTYAAEPKLVVRTVISTGATLGPPAVQQFSVPNMSVSAPIVLPMDVNGDELPDLVVAAPGTGTGLDVALTILLGTGQGYEPAAQVTQPSEEVPWGGQLLPIDYDGDGRTDLVCAFPSGGSSQSLVLRGMPAAGTFPDLMNGITNGLGGTIEIAYAPLTDPAVYSTSQQLGSSQLDAQALIGNRVSGATYELLPGAVARVTAGAAPASRLVDFPKYVLSGYTKTDGRGASYAYQHRYAGARIDLTGRGWLGFQTTQGLDLNVGTTTESTYNQAFPWTHTPASSQLCRTSDGALMQSHAFIYQPPIAPAAPPNLAAPYAVHLAKRETSLYTLGTLDCTQSAVFSYDSFGNVLVTAESSTDPDSPARWTTNTFANDPVGWRLGYVTETKVTADAAQTEVLSWAKTTYDPNTFARTTQSAFAGAWQTTSFSYDAYGNETSVTDPSGATTRTEFDAVYHTFVQTVISPERETGGSLVSTFDFDPCFGVRLHSTDPNQTTTSQTIDGLGRVTGTSGPGPDGSEVRLTTSAWLADANGIYEDVAALVAWDSDTSRWSRRFVDGLGRIYRIASLGPDGATPAYVDRTFNSRGQTLTESPPYYAGQSAGLWMYQYDIYGRVAQVCQPPATPTDAPVITTFDYPTVNSTVQVEAMGTPLARRTVTDYALFGDQRKLIRSEDASGAVGSFSYDALGRIIAADDPAATHRFTYDGLGRRVSVTVSSPSATQFAETLTYDDIARTLTQVDAAANTVVWSYDPLRRLSRKQVNSDPPTTFLYDDAQHAYAQGRCSGVALPDGSSYEFDYDPAGNQSDITLTIAAKAYPVRKSYLPQGMLSQLTYPDGTVVTNSYNAAGSLLTVATGEGTDATTVMTYSGYNALGKPTHLAFGNGTAESYAFDGIGRPTAMTAVAPDATAFVQQVLAWNDLDLLESLTDRLKPANSETFTFDAVGRLQMADGPYGSLSYRYDGVGNLMEKQGVTFTVDGYQFNTGKRDGQEVFAAEYDAAGSLSSITRSGVTSAYGYDGERRLISADGLTFGYDHTGRRLWKRAPDGTTTDYVAPYYEVVTSPSGAREHTCYIAGIAGAVASTTTTEGVAAPTGSGIPAEGIHYLHRNHLRSTVAVTDSSGARVSSIAYYPFGEVQNVDGPDIARQKFTSKELDAESGLYYFHARYYDAATGRFITVDDRISASPARLDGLNLYAYGLNDPTSYLDLTGQFSISSLFHHIGNFFTNDVGTFFARHWQEVVTMTIDTVFIAGGITLLALTPVLGPAAEYGGEMLLGAGLGGVAYNITALATHSEFSWLDWGIQFGLGGATGLAAAGLGSAFAALATAIAARVAVVASGFGRVAMNVGFAGAEGAILGVGAQLAQNLIASSLTRTWTRQSVTNGLLMSTFMGFGTGTFGKGAETGLLALVTRGLSPETIAETERADSMMQEVMERRFGAEVEREQPTDEDLAAHVIVSESREKLLVTVTPNVLMSGASYAIPNVPNYPKW